MRCILLYLSRHVFIYGALNFILFIAIDILVYMFMWYSYLMSIFILGNFPNHKNYQKLGGGGVYVLE